MGGEIASGASELAPSSPLFVTICQARLTACFTCPAAAAGHGAAGSTFSSPFHTPAPRPATTAKVATVLANVAVVAPADPPLAAAEPTAAPGAPAVIALAPPAALAASAAPRAADAPAAPARAVTPRRATNRFR